MRWTQGRDTDMGRAREQRWRTDADGCGMWTKQCLSWRPPGHHLSSCKFTQSSHRHREPGFILRGRRWRLASSSRGICCWLSKRNSCVSLPVRELWMDITPQTLTHVTQTADRHVREIIGKRTSSLLEDVSPVIWGASEEQRKLFGCSEEHRIVHKQTTSPAASEHATTTGMTENVHRQQTRLLLYNWNKTVTRQWSETIDRILNQWKSTELHSVLLGNSVFYFSVFQ